MVRKRGINNELFDHYKAKPYFLKYLTLNSNKNSFYKKNVSEIDALHKMVDSYALELKQKLNSSPLKEFVFILKQAKKRRESEAGVCLDKAEVAFRYYIPDDLGRSKFKDLFNVGDIIKSINMDMNLCWKYMCINKDDIDLVKQCFNDYAVVKAKSIIIENLNKSDCHGNIQAVLMCLAALLRLDFVDTYAFCDSDGYKKYIVKKAGQKNAAKAHSIRKKVLNLAEPLADKKWNEGSKLLHYEMIYDIMPELNDSLREALLKELEKSYKNKTGRYKNKEEYERMKLKINRGGRDFQYDEVLPYIKKVAKRHGRYFDPGEEHRENKKK